MHYTFEKMTDGNYQVRLKGEFVCYSNHTDEKGIDLALKEQGFNSREIFLNYCQEEVEESLKNRKDCSISK